MAAHHCEHGTPPVMLWCSSIPWSMKGEAVMAPRDAFSLAASSTASSCAAALTDCCARRSTGALGPFCTVPHNPGPSGWYAISLLTVVIRRAAQVPILRSKPKSQRSQKTIKSYCIIFRSPSPPPHPGGETRHSLAATRDKAHKEFYTQSRAEYIFLLLSSESA